MTDLKEKNIIDTGASGGIGHSIIEKLNNNIGKKAIKDIKFL